MSSVPGYAYRLLNGIDVERWLLKLACGVIAAQNESVPLAWVKALFGRAELEPMSGLYMHAPLGDSVDGESGMRCGLFSQEGVASGARFSFGGFSLTLDLIGDGRTHREQDIGSLKIYRPSGIWFEHFGAATFHVGLEWDGRLAAEESVVIHVLDRARDV
jgi:hypothetical protein